MNPDRDVVNTALCIQLEEDYIGPFPSSHFTPVDVRNPRLEAMHREHRAYSDPSHPHHEVYTGAFMDHYDKSGDVVKAHMAGQDAISAQTGPLTGEQRTFASRFRYYDDKRQRLGEDIIPPERTETVLRIAQEVLRSRRVPVSDDHRNLLAKHIARYTADRDTLGKNIDMQG